MPSLGFIFSRAGRSQWGRPDLSILHKEAIFLRQNFVQYYILTFPLIYDIIEIPKRTRQEETRRNSSKGVYPTDLNGDGFTTYLRFPQERTCALY